MKNSLEGEDWGVNIEDLWSCVNDGRGERGGAQRSRRRAKAKQNGDKSVMGF